MISRRLAFRPTLAVSAVADEVGLRRVAVDHLLQLFAHLEEGRALRGNVDRFTGFRVPALSRALANLDLEAPEARESRSARRS